jgi:hypothetical protein
MRRLLLIGLLAGASLLLLYTRLARRPVRPAHPPASAVAVTPAVTPVLAAAAAPADLPARSTAQAPEPRRSAPPAPPPPPPRPGPRDDDAASHAPEPAPAAETARRDEAVTALQAEVSRLRAEVAALHERLGRVEEALGAEQERRDRQAQDTLDRADGLTALTSRLVQAEQALATGAGDVAAILADAQAIAGEVATSAGNAGASQEATLAYAAQRWIAASREALGRRDLFQARQALQIAGVSAGRARALATAAAAPTALSY